MMDPRRTLTLWLTWAALTLGSGAAVSAAEAMTPETGTAPATMAPAAMAPAPGATVAEGLRHLYTGDLGAAAERFSAAAEADPANAAARYYLGYAYYRMGDFGRARAAFAAAYEADPDFSPVPPQAP